MSAVSRRTQICSTRRPNQHIDILPSDFQSSDGAPAASGVEGPTSYPGLSTIAFMVTVSVVVVPTAIPATMMMTPPEWYDHTARQGK